MRHMCHNPRMCDVVKARKLTAAEWKRRRNSFRERRVSAYSAAISAWLDRLAARLLARSQRQIATALREKKINAIKCLNVELAKAAGLGDLTTEAERILRRYGLAAYNDAGKEASRALGSQWVMRPDAAAEVSDAIRTKVVLLVSQTEDRVRDLVRQTVSDALREETTPSAKEVGRRLARTFMGPPEARPAGYAGVWPGRGTAEEERITADWARHVLGDREQEHIFSFERAQTIARTEIGQAQNTAIADSYEVAGVTEVEWVARGYNPTHDGPGRRNHYLMSKHAPIKMVSMKGSDPSGWFKLPSGLRAPWPQWVGLPAGEVVNCECILLPR